MAKVIQIRGVPDEVHAKLVDAAAKAGKSLTVFLADELALVAFRADLAWHNEQVIRAGQAAINAKPSTGRGAAEVRKGREERDRQLMERARTRR